MNKQNLRALSFLAGAIFLQAAASEVVAQDGFAAPTCAKKYSFYPQGGNFFGDLFPTNFVDLDNSTGIQDWHCGNYTYDGHRGIDTDILGFAAQAVGVPIFAALDGTVVEAHDGEPDMNTQGQNVPANYVKLDHGDGHTTTYLHMKRNSVAVSVGQPVTAGQQIGLTGSSGQSTAPHLHFQSELNGAPFEPFAGSCRSGVSSWASQPAFRTDQYLREIVLTSQDLTTWQGFPFDTSRTGTFLAGPSRTVSVWSLLANGDALRSISLRYLRPDNSVALAPAPFTTSSWGRNTYFYFTYIFDLDVTGLWHIEISINNQIVANAPFTVIPSGSGLNHTPGGVQAAFDPPAPTAADVVFCRITQPTLFLDPDYDLPRFRYLWQVNGNTVRDVVSAGLADAIPRNSAATGDTITCTITTSDGNLTGGSNAISVPVLAPASVSDDLLNISTRLPVRMGDDVLIGGMIALGSETKKVIIRAIGPSLGGGGVQNFLPDPVLELHSGGTTIASNDDWMASPQAADILATGIAPASSLESAIIADLNPGQAYTAVVRGKGAATGIAVVEAYDLAQDGGSKLANISTRGFIDLGDDIMIGGFIIGGGGLGGAGVVVRAIGPSLSGSVTNPLADPVLEIHDGNGVLATFNDNWQDCQAAEIQATGLQPTNDAEATVLARLRPGNYTAIVRGNNSTTGVGLIEVYNIQ